MSFSNKNRNFDLDVTDMDFNVMHSASHLAKYVFRGFKTKIHMAEGEWRVIDEESGNTLISADTLLSLRTKLFLMV